MNAGLKPFMTSTEISIGELLHWYADAGVDTALLDDPVDQFAASEKAKAVKPSSAPAPKANAPAPNRVQTPPPRAPAPQTELAVPDSNAIAKAATLAAGASTIEELRAIMESFDGCNLKFSARSTVFADGNPKAKLMIVGEAPGRDEDAQGVPFVGKTGQLLDKMLAAIGLDRTSVYITNVIPWRPPGNRTPSQAEADICLPFIERHIELADPSLLMLMGGGSAKMVLKSKSGIMSLRGKWVDVQLGEKYFATLPTLHPDYLLRQPGHKRMAWADLLAIKQKYDELD